MSDRADSLADHGSVPTRHLAAHRSLRAPRPEAVSRRGAEEQVRSLEHVPDVRDGDATGARALPLLDVRLPRLLLLLSKRRSRGCAGDRLPRREKVARQPGREDRLPRREKVARRRENEQPSRREKMRDHTEERSRDRAGCTRNVDQKRLRAERWRDNLEGRQAAAPKRDRRHPRDEADGCRSDRPRSTQVTGGRFAESVDSPLMSRNGSSFLYVR